MLIKQTPLKSISIKQGPQEVAEGIGQFEAIVATYDVDSVGDKIVPGAFAKSLDQWKTSGRAVPVIWSHQHADPFAHIGETLDIAERDEGLWVKAQLDLDNPTARQVWKLLKSGRVDQFSFAYDVEDSRPDPETKGIEDLLQLKLYEIGPTLIGANQETRTLEVKSDEDSPEAGLSSSSSSAPETKAGRVLSARNEADLRNAVELIEGVLSQLGSPMPDEPNDESKSSSKSAPSAPEPDDGNEEDRESGNSEDPNGDESDDSGDDAQSMDALLALIEITEQELTQ